MDPKEQLKALGIVPASEAGRLTDEEKERRSQLELDRLLGPGDEVAHLALFKIATGVAATETINRMGEPVTKRPSFQDQMTAWGMLMDRHRGRPVQKHQHELKPPADTKWDPDGLELDDIKRMRQLAAKATTAGVVDAEFEEEKK